MSEPEPIKVTIKFYEEEKFVELPLDYDVFIQNICNMLQTEKELIGTFQFSYQNNSDLKIYLIKNSDDYLLFLKTCAEKNANTINVQLASEDNIENNNIQIKDTSENKIIIEEEKEIKKEKDEGEDNINNKFNNIQINNNINNYKKNSGNIANNIEDDLGALEFSMLSEKENINNKNNKNDNINNNIINKNINNNIISNDQINFQASNVKFNLKCDICKKEKLFDIIYYCKDCDIFFCDVCEVEIGKIHKHCYYKIRNKNQYYEIKGKADSIPKKLDNMNQALNNSIINKGQIIENSVKGIWSEGSKFLGNIGNSIRNFFGSNENDNNQNNNNPNELNNPYEIKNDMGQNNNDNNIPDDNQMKLLIAQAKANYNLTDISDIDIERALVQHKGNIDEAVSMLLLNNNL